MNYLGTYAGQVVSTADALRAGRVKVRVPILHGLLGGPAGLITDEQLPWALPVALGAGGTHESGGMSWIPEPGDQVWVRFLDGSLAKPIWEWGNQNLKQIPNFGRTPLHAYSGSGNAARRGALTRFQHWLEFRPDGIAAWTKSNYIFEINDGGAQGTGYLSWTSALGFSVSLDDGSKSLSVKVPNVYYATEKFTMVATEFAEMTTPVAALNFGRVELGGDYGSFEIDATARTSKGMRMAFNSLGLELSGALVISAPKVYITNQKLGYGSGNLARAPVGSAIGLDGNRVLLGYGAGDPLVRMSDLLLALKSVKTSFDSHTHPGVGAPSSPARYTAYASQLMLGETQSRTNKAVT